MRKVRCPRCAAITPTEGNHVRCARCGLQGRVGDAPRGPGGAPAKDPFVITLDLRKLSPTHWGRGAKALAAATILVGAFFLGGFAGVAFEKARTEISDGFEEGEAVLGGAKSGANASLESADGESNDASEDVAGEDGGSSLLDDGSEDPDENTTDGNTTDGNTTDPPAGPPNDNYGDGEAPAPFVFNGTAPAMTEPFATGQDLILLEVEFYGDAFFSLQICELNSSCVKASDAAAVISAQDYGDYVHDRIFSFPAGEYQIKVKSQGTWSVTVRQPQPAEGSAPVSMHLDNGDGVHGPLDFQGAYTVDFGANGHGSVTVQAYLLNGTKVPGCSFSGPTAGDNDPYAASRTCDATGLVYFDISAPKRSDAPQSWVLDIKAA